MLNIFANIKNMPKYLLKFTEYNFDGQIDSNVVPRRTLNIWSQYWCQKSVSHHNWLIIDSAFGIED